MEQIIDIIRSIDILKKGELYKGCDINPMQISKWAKNHVLISDLTQPTKVKLKSLKSKLSALYDVISELSENPSLDRQGELLKISEKYIKSTKALKIIKDGDFTILEQNAADLDKAVSRLEKHLLEPVEPSEPNEPDESFVLTFSEEKKETLTETKPENVKVEGDAYEKHKTRFLAETIPLKLKYRKK